LPSQDPDPIQILDRLETAGIEELLDLTDGLLDVPFRVVLGFQVSAVVVKMLRKSPFVVFREGVDQVRLASLDPANDVAEFLLGRNFIRCKRNSANLAVAVTVLTVPLLRLLPNLPRSGSVLFTRTPSRRSVDRVPNFENSHLISPALALFSVLFAAEQLPAFFEVPAVAPPNTNGLRHLAGRLLTKEVTF
jgi:hypothetical protein